MRIGSHCAEWDPDEIRDFSQSQYKAILGEEQTLAVSYWRLGRALNLLREDCKYGQWAQLLGVLGIDKTRASKARAIAGTFDEERLLDGRTVREACQRRRQSRQPGMTNGQVAALKLRRLLVRVVKTANGVLESMEDSAPDTMSEVQLLLDRGSTDLGRARTQLNRWRPGTKADSRSQPPQTPK